LCCFGIRKPGEQPLALSPHQKEQVGIGFTKLIDRIG